MVNRSRLLSLPLLAGVVALSGCGVAPDGVEEAAPGAAAEPIKGGYDDATDTSVVDIVWLSGQSFGECSGSLIAPNLVLTARHCVADIINGASGIDCSVSKFGAHDVPGNFYVSTKQYLTQNPADFHTVKEVITPTPTGVCGNDVALLVLSGNVDPSETVPIVPRVDTPSVRKDPYSAVGFGGTVDNGTGSGQRRRLDGLIIICMDKTCPTGYLDPKTEWEGDHGICEGDSGGPALDDKGRVIGVTSRGGAGCTSPIYGYVYGWADWIKQNGQHAAQVGGYNPLPWMTGASTDPAYSAPVGDTCPADGCAGGYCLQDAGGTYCTRPCSDAGPCPDGYTCTAVGDAQLCERPPPSSSSSSSSGSAGSSSGSSGTNGDNGTKSGCSARGADPTQPVPWRAGAAIAAVGALLLRRRRRGSSVAE